MVDRGHPLAVLAAASRDCAAVQLRALPEATRLIIRGTPSGLVLPETMRATVVDDRALLWLGPDEFMLLADGIVTIDAGANSAVVDVSHRNTALGVSGPRAAWAINAFCPLDLHPSAFPAGMCTRTVFGKSEIVLWRKEPDAFHIDVARSFAPYVWACLEEARREFCD
jgi:heterotetrameric sarcosine oxidase gamma subunit